MTLHPSRQENPWSQNVSESSVRVSSSSSSLVLEIPRKTEDEGRRTRTSPRQPHIFQTRSQRDELRESLEFSWIPAKTGTRVSRPSELLQAMRSLMLAHCGSASEYIRTPARKHFAIRHGSPWGRRWRGWCAGLPGEICRSHPQDSAQKVQPLSEAQPPRGNPSHRVKPSCSGRRWNSTLGLTRFDGHPERAGRGFMFS
jgi:hypothetical protein